MLFEAVQHGIRYHSASPVSNHFGYGWISASADLFAGRKRFLRVDGEADNNFIGQASQRGGGLERVDAGH